MTRVLVISCPQNALSHTYCFKRKNVASGIRILYHEAQQVLKRLAEGRCFLNQCVAGSKAGLHVGYDHGERAGQEHHAHARYTQQSWR